jgi:hypothetical protein
MFWASRRQTTRIEDEAYCLLGLFGVNMPLLYGEGREAYRRLQEEILRVEEDYTLFAWCPRVSQAVKDRHPHLVGSEGMLARRTSDFTEFQSSNNIAPRRDMNRWQSAGDFRPHCLSRDPFTIFRESSDHLPPYLTSRGLRISVPLTRSRKIGEYLACVTLMTLSSKDSHMLCVLLRRIEGSEDRYIKPLGARPHLISRKFCDAYQRESIYVEQPVIHTITQTVGTRFNPSCSLAKDNFIQRWTPDIVILKIASNKSNLLERCDIPLMNTQTLPGRPHGPKGYPGHDDMARMCRSLAYGVDNIKAKEFDQMVRSYKPAASYLVNDFTYNYLAFKFKDCSPPFIVRFSTRGDPPWCQVGKIDSAFFDALRASSMGLPIDFRMPKGSRINVNINTEDRMHKISITVSMRQIATRASGNWNFPRYILSVKANFVH